MSLSQTEFQNHLQTNSSLHISNSVRPKSLVKLHYEIPCRLQINKWRVLYSSLPLLFRFFPYLIIWMTKLFFPYLSIWIEMWILVTYLTLGTQMFGPLTVLLFCILVQYVRYSFLQSICGEQLLSFLNLYSNWTMWNYWILFWCTIIWKKYAVVES